MTNFDHLLQAVGKVGEKLNEIPEARETLIRAQRGEITIDEAVFSLVSVLKERGKLGELAETAALAVPKEESSSPLFLVEDERGTKKLNPLFEAAVLERASLDGDVPELRFGPLPEGGRPAIPVLTDSLDPVLVGAMLERAADQVQAQLSSALQAHAQECEALLLRGGGELPPVPTGVEIYRAGEVPQPLAVPQPERLSIPDHRAQEYNYRALATTQGRVSLARPIARRVGELLQEAGLHVSLGSPNSEVFQATWALQAWGQEDFSPTFNHAEVACSALAEKLLGQNPSRDLPLLLEVTPYNGIADRTFGWVAKLGR
jgi:hypothetical protein